MKITPITNSAPGEHVIAVQPPLAPEVDPGWRRRLNLFTGRSLSDVALSAEQAVRGGRLAARGQMVAHGIVAGLALQVTEAADGALVGHLSAGLGITVSGEDVSVPADLSFDLRQVRVFASAALLTAPLPEDEQPASGFAGYGRAVGPRLQTFVQPESALPRAGILLLQPITAELAGRVDPDDPCAYNPSAAAYEDWQKADGCRLLYYAWPGDVLAMPPLPVGDADARVWRNRLAYAIFEAEAGRGPDDPLPWEAVGLPIGLVAFDAAWQLRVVDRHSVARAGGGPKRRSGLANGWLPDGERYLTGAAPASANPYLWQARMQQLAEQVAEAYLDGVPSAETARQFALLPPAGLLPVDAVDLLTEGSDRVSRIGRQHFFPPGFQVDAAPVPLEQLDAALAASASLGVLDASALEQVRLLAPVPQAWFEPDLLRVEQVDPEFQQALDTLVVRRGRWLARRRDVRLKYAALSRATAGQAVTFPSPDPLALEPNEVEAEPLDPDVPALAEPEAAYGTEARGGQFVVTALETLRQQLRRSSPLRMGSAVPLAGVNPEPAVALVRQVQENITPRLGYQAATRQLTFDGVMQQAERDKLQDFARNTDFSEIFAKAIGALYDASQRDELGQLDTLGLSRFIAMLESKVRQADDRVDFGFLRVQTDIYRIRQLVLGNTAGTRLAVSPTLATIAQGASAASTRANLRTFYDKLKASAVPATAPTRGVADAPADAAAGDAPSVAEIALRETSFGAITRAAFTPIAIAPLPEATLVQLGGAKIGADLTKLQPTASVQVTTKGSGAVIAAPIAAVTPIEVIGQAPLVGAVDLRTATIAERLEPPKAPEAKDFSVASKHEVVSSLAELVNMGMNLDDLEVPGALQRNADGQIEFDAFGQAKRQRRFLKDVDFSRDILAEPTPQRNDESAYFVSSVELLDHTVAALRATEGRVQAYRLAIAACQKTLAELQSLAQQANSRLTAIGGELVEARHDVALARALLADEERRVADINERRDRVVRQHVTFLAYVRPRLVESRQDAPTRGLVPAVVEDAAPACLAGDSEPPVELQAMIDLLRDAPVKWFTHVPRLLDRITALPALQSTLAQSVRRAASALLDAEAAAPAATAKTVSQAMVQAAGVTQAKTASAALSGIFAAQQHTLVQARASVAAFDLTLVAGQGWRRARDQAADVVSLGDLIAGGHGSSGVSQAAARELAQIGQIAGCLYAAFDQLLPVIRLAWAEILSQYDAPADLRDLANLPRWGQIDYLDRRQLQGLVDWLYGRVDTDQPAALALMNDLVRVCILLASHAPVNRIVAGRVQRDVVARPGGRIELAALDVTQVAVGMQVVLFEQDKVVARAVVEDLAAGQVAARVTAVAAVDADGKAAPSVTLKAGAFAQFASAALTLGRGVR